MQVKDILNYLEEMAPIKYAEDYDNVGLLVGDTKKFVKKLMICLDLNEAAITKSISQNVDLIISHHPFIFTGMKNITYSNYKGSIIQKLIKNDISYIAMHTNYDITLLNDYLAKMIGLVNVKNLKEDLNQDIGLGKTGELEKEKPGVQFIVDLKQGLDINTLRVVGEIPKNIKRVAVFCGSFDGDIAAVYNAKSDVLVTGDLKYHDAQELIENNIFTIDAGHYHTEKIFVEQMGKIIKEKFKDIEILEFNYKDVFEYK